MLADAPIGLVIETAIGMGADLALCRGAEVLDTQGLEPGERSARGLLPAVDRLLARHSLQPSQFRFLGLTIGPGSFTGLRVGITFAKTLGYSLGCRIIPINTFDVWARQVQFELHEGELEGFRRMIILYDAQRGELFTQLRPLQQDSQTSRAASSPSEFMGSAPQRGSDPFNTPIEIQKPENLLQVLQPGDLLTGTGVAKLSQAQQERLRQNGISILPLANRQLTLRALALETWQALEAGGDVDPFSLMPRYYRDSAAEEKRRLG